jgi:hypothetical protein
VLAVGVLFGHAPWVPPDTTGHVPAAGQAEGLSVPLQHTIVPGWQAAPWTVHVEHGVLPQHWLVPPGVQRCPALEQLVLVFVLRAPQ